MRDHDRADIALAVEQFGHCGSIDVARTVAGYIGKNRNGAGANDHVDDVGNGIRRQDDFLAGPHQVFDRKVDADACLRHGYDMGDRKIGRERRFQIGYCASIVGVE